MNFLMKLLGARQQAPAQQAAPMQAAPRQPLRVQQAVPMQPRLAVGMRPQPGLESENAGSPFGFGNPDGTNYSNISPMDEDVMMPNRGYQAPAYPMQGNMNPYNIAAYNRNPRIRF